jgi:transposase
VAVGKKYPFNFLVIVDGLRELRRGELGEEFVGSYLYQVHLYRGLESTDYGRLLSENNAYIKVKRMVCPSYRSNLEAIRNFCAAWRSIGCDLHSRQQTIAMLDTDTGVLVEKTLEHDGGKVREFYAALPGPVLVGIEATGSMHWFLKLMEELKIECRVGHPAKIRAAEPRKQKHDRGDALLLLNLLAENRFPSIWMPSTEQRDLGALLRHRHQWVRPRTRVQNTLQSMALSNGLRRGNSLWSQAGQHALQALPLAPHASQRRTALLTLYPQLQESIDDLDQQVSKQALQHPQAQLWISPYCVYLRRYSAMSGCRSISRLAAMCDYAFPMRASQVSAQYRKD